MRPRAAASRACGVALMPQPVGRGGRSATVDEASPSYAPWRHCHAIRASTERHRAGEEQLRPGQSHPRHLVAADELDEEPEDAVRADVPDERRAGRQVGPAQPEPEDAGTPRGGRRSRRRRTGAAVDRPGHVGAGAGQLGEEAAHPADRHAERDRRREQVPGPQRVVGDALGDVHSQPGSDQPAQDRPVAVEPLLGERGVVAQVDVLRPGPEPHQQRATHQRTRDDVDQPLVGLAPAPRLDHEDDHRHRDAEAHEQLMARERSDAGQHAAHPHTATGASG